MATMETLDDFIIEYEKVNVSLAVGQTLNSEEVRLPDGDCRRIALKAIGNHTDFIDVAIKDNGSEVTEPIHYEFLEKTNAGSFWDSWKPDNFLCGRTLKVQLSTDTPLAAEFKVQVVFVVVKRK